MASNRNPPPAEHAVGDRAPVRPIELAVRTESRYSAIRKLFAAAEAAGEFIGIRYGFLRAGTSEPEWVYYSHKDFDGIGAFAQILRDRRAELTTIPQVKYYPAHSAIVTAITHWPRYLRPHRPLQFVPLEHGPTAHGEGLPPTAVAWHVFDERTTSSLRLRARDTAITVNTLLLHALTGAVRSLLIDSAAPVPWMIPVNMRGGVQQFRDTDNHTSYLGIVVYPGEPASETHRRVLLALSRGEHWGNWYAFKLAHLISPRLRMKLAINGKALSQWSVGAFSNLGEWDVEKKLLSPEIAGNWIFCPPALQTQMIAAGCITFQGRLGLAVQAHSALTTAAATIRSLVSGWVDRVKDSITSASIVLAIAFLGVIAIHPG